MGQVMLHIPTSVPDTLPLKLAPPSRFSPELSSANMISAVFVLIMRTSRLVSATEYVAPKPPIRPPFVSTENLVIEPVTTSCTPRILPMSAACEEFTRPLWPKSCSDRMASICERSMTLNLPVLKSCVTSSSAAALPRLSPQ